MSCWFTSFVSGLPKDEWIRTTQLLNAYSQVTGNVIKVLHGEDDCVNLIYLHLVQQRELHEKFGEVVQLHNTYKVNKSSMPQFTLLVIENSALVNPSPIYSLRT